MPSREHKTEAKQIHNKIILLGWGQELPDNLVYAYISPRAERSIRPQGELKVGNCRSPGFSLQGGRWQLPLLLFSLWQMLLASANLQLTAKRTAPERENQGQGPPELPTVVGIYDVSTRSFETQKEGNHLREKKAKRGQWEQEMVRCLT